MKFTTPQRESSRWALGNDGADKNNPDSQLRTTDEQQRQDQESSSDSRETSDRPSSDKSESKSSESTKSDQSASEKSRSGERTDDGRSEDQKTTEQRDGREPGRRESDTSSKQRDQDQSDKNKPDKDQSSKDRSDKSQSDKEQRDSSESRSREDKTSKDGSRSDTGHSRDQDKKPSGEKQTQNQLKPPNRPTQAPSKPWLQLPHVSTSLGGIFKLVVYAILFCIVGYLLWKSRARVMAAIRQFLQELREFWARLFGGREPSSEEAAQEASRAPSPRPFSDYRDPFASGLAGRNPPEQIVRYTFEALEAWARENDCRREPDQTPREFAQQVSDRSELLREGVNLLADLYSLVAYAGKRPDAKSIEPLAQLWQALNTVQRKDSCSRASL